MIWKKDLLTLKNKYLWLEEIDSCILRTTLEDLDKAFQNYFHQLTRYPKFKNYHSKQSYRTNCIRSYYKEKIYQNIKIDIKNKTIKLPKLEEIKIKTQIIIILLNL